MNFTKKAIIFIAVISIASCGTQQAKNTGAGNMDSLASAGPTIPDTSEAKGVVTDSIACRADAAQCYALYLPSGYTPAKSYPVVFFFDAHARGALPVGMYHEVAEKYGFILAGSDISRNGNPWQTTEAWGKAMIADVKGRFSINAAQVYTSGFSGGSRVASSIAILEGGVAGVIGCAAGFPSLDQVVKRKFDYVGLVGDYDFNLLEMESLDRQLSQNGFRHQLLVSGGVHGWAPAEDFETALLWMQVNAMRHGRQTTDETLRAALRERFQLRIADAQKNREPQREQELLTGLIDAGLDSNASAKAGLETLRQSEAFRESETTSAQIRQTETALQQDLSQEISVENADWWKKKMAELNHDAATARTPQQAQMYKRVVNYMGLVGFMSVFRTLKLGDLDRAAGFLDIFKVIDPANPDCSYLTADYYMLKGNRDEALNWLDKAATAGYNEVATLATDPVFTAVHGDPRFQAVLKKISANAKQ